MFAQERNTFKVKKPLLFRVSYKNKIGYILGTIHVFSSAILPDKCLNIIKTCQSFVGESTAPTIQEAEHFQTNFLSYCGRRMNDVNWFQQLSIEHQRLSQEFFNLELTRMYAQYAPRVEISEVRLSIAIKYIQSFGMNLLSDLPDKDDQSNDQPYQKILGAMDLEICNLFDNEHGLEDPFNITRLEADDECELNSLVDDLLIIQKLTRQSFENASSDNGLEELENIWKIYHLGGHLTDFAKTRELDEEDESVENNKMQKRNKLFFANMLKRIETLPGPVLVAVGVEHLIGKTGILMQLDSHRIEVEMYEHNDSGEDRFKKFEYCYKYYLQALEYINSGLYFSSPAHRLKETNYGASEDLSKDTILELKKSRLYGCFVS